MDLRDRLERGHGGGGDLRSKLRTGGGGVIDARAKLGRGRRNTGVMRGGVTDARSRLGFGAQRQSPIKMRDNFTIVAANPLSRQHDDRVFREKSSAFMPAPRANRSRDDGSAVGGMLASALFAASTRGNAPRRAPRPAPKASLPVSTSALRQTQITFRNDAVAYDEVDMDSPKLTKTLVKKGNSKILQRVMNKPSADQTTIILITNLAQSVSESDVSELCGTMDGFVSAVMIESGLAKATFKTVDNAKAMIDAYNEREFDGQEMRMHVITEGKPQKPVRSPSPDPSEAMDESGSLPELRLKLASKTKKSSGLSMDKDDKRKTKYTVRA